MPLLLRGEPNQEHHCLQVLGGGTMKIRTNDAAYMTHVDRWWGELLPRMTRLLYSNGGPIVMVQVLSPAPAGSAGLQCSSCPVGRLYLSSCTVFTMRLPNILHVPQSSVMIDSAEGNFCSIC